MKKFARKLKRIILKIKKIISREEVLRLKNGYLIYVILITK
ncbi:hypothetical protein [Fusobacterium perfoetens]|nr:hypothetical protein [Fusobacterium perfoetens]